jgi:hypothetical protein
LPYQFREGDLLTGERKDNVQQLPKDSRIDNWPERKNIFGDNRLYDGVSNEI